LDKKPIRKSSCFCDILVPCQHGRMKMIFQSLWRIILYLCCIKNASLRNKQGRALASDNVDYLEFKNKIFVLLKYLTVG
jgi:hypothetical protein